MSEARCIFSLALATLAASSRSFLARDSETRWFARAALALTWSKCTFARASVRFLRAFNCSGLTVGERDSRSMMDSCAGESGCSFSLTGIMMRRADVHMMFL